MKTVNEMAKIAGISKRTIRYYDQIGILKPSGISESGYRLYDDKALEILQQILLFKELEVPLKDIKSVIDNPKLDRISLLESHKKLLISKKEYLEDIIKLIDKVIKDPKLMIFDEFNLQRVAQALERNYEVLKNSNPEGYEAIFKGRNIKNKKDLIDKTLENIRKHPQMITTFYGNVNNYVTALKRQTERIPESHKYTKQACDMLIKLSKLKNKGADCPEVQRLIAIIDDLNIKTTGESIEQERKKPFKETFKNQPEILKDYEKAIELGKQNMDKIYGKGFYDFYQNAIKYYIEHK